MKRVYLDHAATTPVEPEVAEAMARVYRDVHGNPSSVYAEGRAARALVDGAREQVAAAIGATPAEIVFTSGGSEANNLAIKGADVQGIIPEYDAVIFDEAHEIEDVAGDHFGDDELAYLESLWRTFMIRYGDILKRPEDQALPMVADFLVDLAIQMGIIPNPAPEQHPYLIQIIELGLRDSIALCAPDYPGEIAATIQSLRTSPLSGMEL